jgi:hypothetical protein
MTGFMRSRNSASVSPIIKRGFLVLSHPLKTRHRRPRRLCPKIAPRRWLLRVAMALFRSTTRFYVRETAPAEMSSLRVRHLPTLTRGKLSMPVLAPKVLDDHYGTSQYHKPNSDKCNYEGHMLPPSLILIPGRHRCPILRGAWLSHPVGTGQSHREMRSHTLEPSRSLA